MKTVKEEFGTLKNLIMHVLEVYPETRDSDNNLFVQCCKVLGAVDLNDIAKVNINLISIHKIRQVIQNKEGLFLPSSKTQAMRQERAEEVKAWMVSESMKAEGALIQN